MTFHATKRSMRISLGLRSCGATFFLMRLWLRETAEPCLLVRDIEVAREREAASLWLWLFWCIIMGDVVVVVVVERIEQGKRELMSFWVRIQT